jgi:hypothetical protein
MDLVIAVKDIKGHCPNGTAVCSRCFGDRNPTWAGPFLKEYRPCPHLFHW